MPQCPITSNVSGDKGVHCVVEVPADWPVKLSSPLSTVAHTTTASHYRFVVIIQLTGHVSTEQVRCLFQLECKHARLIYVKHIQLYICVQ